jgi:hypothetical protein
MCNTSLAIHRLDPPKAVRHRLSPLGIGAAVGGLGRTVLKQGTTQMIKIASSQPRGITDQACHRSDPAPKLDPYGPGVGTNVLDWPISVVLQRRLTGVKLRRRVMDSPLFNTARLGDVLKDPSSIVAFLVACRGLPQCGDTQITHILSALWVEARQFDGVAAQWSAAETAAGMAAAEDEATPFGPAPAPLVPGDWRRAVTCVFERRCVAEGTCLLLHVPRAIHQVTELSGLWHSHLARTRKRMELRGTVILQRRLLSGTGAQAAGAVKRLAAALPAGVVLREGTPGGPLAPVTCIDEVVVLPVAGGWTVLHQPQLCHAIRAALAAEPVEQGTSEMEMPGHPGRAELLTGGRPPTRRQKARGCARE